MDRRRSWKTSAPLFAAVVLAMSVVLTGPTLILGQADSKTGVDSLVSDPGAWLKVFEGDESLHLVAPAILRPSSDPASPPVIGVAGTRNTDPSDFQATLGYAAVTSGDDELELTELPQSAGVQVTGGAFGPDDAFYVVGTTSPLDPFGLLWRRDPQTAEWDLVDREKGARYLDAVTLDDRVLIVGQLAEEELQQDLRAMTWEIGASGELDPMEIAQKSIAQLVAASPDGRMVVSAFDPTAILVDRAGSVIFLSGDGGDTWMQVEAPIENRDQSIVRVAVGDPGIFVGRVEFDETGQASPMTVFFSEDGGRTWQESLTGSQIADIVRVGDGVVVFGSDGNLQGTQDGREWTRITIPILAGSAPPRVSAAVAGSFALSTNQLADGGMFVPVVYTGSFMGGLGLDAPVDEVADPDLNGDGAFTYDDVVELQIVEAGGEMREGASLTDYDLNDDGVIDIGDVSILYADWLLHEETAGDGPHGDLNGDGVFDQGDVDHLDAVGESGTIPFGASMQDYDLDADGVIDIVDVAILHFRLEGAGPELDPDLNGDGTFDYADVVVLDSFVEGGPMLEDATIGDYDRNGDDAIDRIDVAIFFTEYTRQMLANEMADEDR